MKTATRRRSGSPAVGQIPLKASTASSEGRLIPGRNFADSSLGMRFTFGESEATRRARRRAASPRAGLVRAEALLPREGEVLPDDLAGSAERPRGGDVDFPSGVRT